MIFLKELRRRQMQLYIDVQKVAEGQIPKTQPFLYSADEGVDVGMDGETAVSNNYKEGDNKFTGNIHKVTVNTDPPGLTAKDEKVVEETENLMAVKKD